MCYSLNIQLLKFVLGSNYAHLYNSITMQLIFKILLSVHSPTALGPDMRVIADGRPSYHTYFMGWPTVSSYHTHRAKPTVSSTLQSSWVGRRSAHLILTERSRRLALHFNPHGMADGQLISYSRSEADD
jgi:hypothetical protein